MPPFSMGIPPACITPCPWRILSLSRNWQFEKTSAMFLPRDIS
jgi:hypothetical protein